MSQPHLNPPRPEPALHAANNKGCTTPGICAHIVIANTWGVINSFGIFQAYYTDFLKIPPSQISWIGSLQIFLANFLGVFSGRLSDAGYFRLTIGIGTALQALGAFATSFCTQYWQLMLAQGIVIGTAAGFLCCPMLSVTSTYFSKRRALAVGIVTCGNVTGGLIYPAMARQLLPAIGFGWALRSMAFLQLATTIMVNIVARPRIQTKTSGPLIDWATLKELDFLLYAVGLLFVRDDFPIRLRPSVLVNVNTHRRASPAPTWPSTTSHNSVGRKSPLPYHTQTH